MFSVYAVVTTVVLQYAYCQRDGEERNEMSQRIPAEMVHMHTRLHCHIKTHLDLFKRDTERE